MEPVAVGRIMMRNVATKAETVAGITKWATVDLQLGIAMEGRLG
jgi:hypothetical protein